jgi:hypothetical protein
MNATSLPRGTVDVVMHRLVKDGVIKNVGRAMWAVST